MGEIIERPIPSIPMPFTGERLTSEYGGQTEIEHLHRYLFAREWCREKDVLDVASGEGYGTALLAQVAKSALGVEIASDAVAHASASYLRDNLKYIQGDARAIPVPDASFDVVTSFETIEHFAEQQQFLREVRRVLRPGGLFVVSTPDRDNYSPMGSPVNQYHVKEMTGAEFESLLRSHFAEISVAMQRPIFGSVMLPEAAGASSPLCFERRGATYFEASTGLARPQYLIAFASDGPAADLPSSVYIHSGQLGMLDPQESAARLDAVTAEREARTRTYDALQERIANLTADLAACRTYQADLAACKIELAAARGEAKGALAASEMTEKACAAYRFELGAARAEANALVAAKDSAEKACAAYQTELAWTRNGRVRQLEDEVKNIRLSHSWRVTAPLRSISRLLYRRP